LYESFYGFREKPFALQPDPEFLYLSANHRMALTLLEYGILNQTGFTVITGDVGAGKTTLLRRILQEISQELTVGFISNTHKSLGHLMQWVLMAFNLDSAREDTLGMFKTFSRFLTEQDTQNRRVILVVDEAQNLDSNLMEELRLLSNIHTGKTQILQVILSGQPGLRDLLRRPELVQFAQRVGVDYHLGPMNDGDTKGYIEHRLRVVGGSPSLFTVEACHLVHRVTGGVPRLINQVCDTALVYGFADRTDHITARIVSDAARDKKQGGIVPLIQEGATVFPLTGYGKKQTALKFINGASKPQDKPIGPTPEPPDVLYQRAERLQAEDRYDEAIRLLERAAVDPAYWLKVFFKIGLCHRDAGRPTEAVKSFRKALTDQSASFHEIIAVRYELGYLLEALGRKAEAMDCYQRVYLTDPYFRDVAGRIQKLSGVPGPQNYRFGWIRQRLKQWMHGRQI
jgi:type II secretory pathway predicted ATPase ExeA